MCMDADLAWTAAGTIAGAAALMIGGPQLVITWLDRRDQRRDRSMEAASHGAALGSSVHAPLGRLPETGLRGRNSTLRALQRQLVRLPGRPQVITGMGGVGKSALALSLCAYAQQPRRWRRRRSVWWLSAVDEASFTASLISLVRHLGGTEHDQQIIAEHGLRGPDLVWSLLERAPRGWLLVIDNADAPALLTSPQPTGSPDSSTVVADGTGWIRPTMRGLVVVTSRVVDLRVWGIHSSDLHELGPLTQQDATYLLLDLAYGASDYRPRGAPSAELQVAEQLANQLGCLPLALYLAGSAIGSPYSTWQSLVTYRAALTFVGPKLLSPPPDTPHAVNPRGAVLRTWELSLDALASHGVPQARTLLRILSSYAPAVPIPASLIVLDRLPDLLAAHGGESPDLWSSEALAHALSALARVGLINMIRSHGPGGPWQGVLVHRLVADTNRTHLNDGENPESVAASIIRHTAVVLLAEAIARLRPGEASDWPRWRELTPHVHALVDSVADHLAPRHLATLVETAAQTVSFHIWTRLDEAGLGLGDATLARAQALELDDPAILHLRIRLARIRAMQGSLTDWEQAETQMRQILHAQITKLGPEHRHTLFTRHSLTWAVGNQGRWKPDRWAQAEAEYHNIIEIQTRVLGAADPDTLSSRQILGWFLANQGHWARAEAEYRQVFENRLRLLGPENPATLATRHSLAWAIANQRRWTEAEQEYWTVMEAQTRLLGPDHPDTLATRHDLAALAGMRGQWELARAEYRQVLAGRERTLGPTHQATETTRHALRRAQHCLLEWTPDDPRAHPGKG